MKTLSAFLFTLLVTSLTPSLALALTAHCYCKASCADNTNQTHVSMIVKDYGEIATYNGLNPQNDANQTACNTLCTSRAAPDTGTQALATLACNIGCPNGSLVRAWSAVGTKEYKTAQLLGTLHKTPAVSQAKCTPPSAPNAPVANQPGVTTDGKCKAVVCQPITGTPLPSNGTAIGAWGFTWGNGVYQWVPPVITVVTPAQCHF